MISDSVSFFFFFFFLHTFTFCLISRPETLGRNWIFLADSAVGATYGVAFVTSEEAF